MASYARQGNHTTKKKISVSYVIREREERRHRSGVNSLQYDPCLGRLYSAGRDSVIKIWQRPDFDCSEPVRDHDCSSENESNAKYQDDCDDLFLKSMEHHTDWVNDITLCCNGRNLLSVSNDTTIKVWNAHQGHCLSTLKSHKDYAKCLAYAKEREMVASAGFDRMIYLWDIQTLTMLTNTKNTVTTKPIDGSKSSIYSLAVNCGGTIIASGSTEKVIRLWDPRSRQKLLKLRGHTDNVKSLLFSKDGSMLLSGSSDGTVRLWSISQQRCISIIRNHDGGVWTVQANDSFSTVYSGGRDGKIFITDLRNVVDSTLLCSEESPILKVLIVDDVHYDKFPSLWVATTDSSLKNWSLDPKVLGYEENHSELCESDIACAKNHRIIIKGSPAVINYHILNDKRHIISLESDNSVALYDVLTARKIETLLPPGYSCQEARQAYEDEIKERFKMVYVPSWFSVDLKIGLLCIHLEESEALSAWVSARDYGFIPHVDGQDPKINLGCLMLQALLEYWPPTFENYDTNIKSQIMMQDVNSDCDNSHDEYHDLHYTSTTNNTTNGQSRSSYLVGIVHSSNHSQRVGNQYFSIPSHTPIIISEGNQTITRFLAYEASNENDHMMLQELLPSWISELVTDITRSQPKFTKIPFFLLPHPDSGIKSLRKERLSASDMLQIRKVVEHVCEKMLVNLLDENNTLSSNPEQVNMSSKSSHSSNEQPRMYPPDKVELYCNDQKLEDHLDLRTVRHFIWKSGCDLVLHYMPIK